MRSADPPAIARHERAGYADLSAFGGSVRLWRITRIRRKGTEKKNAGMIKTEVGSRRTEIKTNLGI